QVEGGGGGPLAGLAAHLGGGRGAEVVHRPRGGVEGVLRRAGGGLVNQPAGGRAGAGEAVALLGGQPVVRAGRGGGGGLGYVLRQPGEVDRGEPAFDGRQLRRGQRRRRPRPARRVAPGGRRGDEQREATGAHADGPPGRNRHLRSYRQGRAGTFPEVGGKG